MENWEQPLLPRMMPKWHQFETSQQLDWVPLEDSVWWIQNTFYTVQVVGRGGGTNKQTNMQTKNPIHRQRFFPPLHWNNKQSMNATNTWPCGLFDHTGCFVQPFPAVSTQTTSHVVHLATRYTLYQLLSKNIQRCVLIQRETLQRREGKKKKAQYLLSPAPLL